MCTSFDVYKWFLPYRKTTDDGFVKKFKIWANKDKEKYRTEKITVHGTCCWEIYDRLGKLGNLKPGQDNITPSVAYIRTLKTKKCNNDQSS